MRCVDFDHTHERHDMVFLIPSSFVGCMPTLTNLCEERIVAVYRQLAVRRGISSKDVTLHDLKHFLEDTILMLSVSDGHINVDLRH